MRAFNFIFTFFLFFTTGLSQQVTVPPLALDGIKFQFKIENIPDTTSIVNVSFLNDEDGVDFSFIQQKGIIDTQIVLSNSGNYSITSSYFPGLTSGIRVLPGIFSIIPPLLAILLALVFRQVIVALFAGVFTGAIFIYDFNPLLALMRLIDRVTVETVVDRSHTEIIIFTLLFGGVVSLISSNGGTKGLANVLIKIASTRKNTMIATWLMGLAIFFDDYANTLIVGNLMRPITDRFKISREKLAFIVDSTSAPVAGLMIVSTWIGFEIGLIQDGLRLINSETNAYDVFIQTIPYRFYPLAMLFFVFYTSFVQKDFGPMLKAERRALKGELVRNGATIAEDLTGSTSFKGNHTKPKWYNAVVPIFILVFGTVGGLAYSGIVNLHAKGVFEYSIRDVISNSESNLALMWSSLAACIVAIVMTISQKILNLGDTIDAWYRGIRSMLFAVLVLIFAWEISYITDQLQTAGYLIHLLSDKVDPGFLPVLVFLICAITSFSTGTSWGTMAIMMPIVIPLSFTITTLLNYSPADSELILYGVISSVLAGSVFGDHCSPIADTTILSSMASSCDHIDHVKTQLPYAIVTGVICMLVGDLPTAFGFSPYLSIGLIWILLALVISTIGKKPIELS